MEDTSEALERVFVQMLIQPPTGPAFSVILSDQPDRFYEDESVIQHWETLANKIENIRQTLKIGAPSLILILESYEQLIRQLFRLQHDTLLERSKEAKISKNINKESLGKMAIGSKGTLNRSKDKKFETVPEDEESIASGDSNEDDDDVIAELLEGEKDTVEAVEIISEKNKRRSSVGRGLEMLGNILRLSYGRKSLNTNRRSLASSISSGSYIVESDIEGKEQLAASHENLIVLWLKIMQELIELGVDVNKEYCNKTLLDVLCNWEEQSHTKFVTDLVEWLLDHGANVEGGVGVLSETDDEVTTQIIQPTPLVCAVGKGFLNETKLLLLRGAKRDATNEEGLTATQLARKREKFHKLFKTI